MNRRMCGKCEKIYNEWEAKIEYREAPPDAPIRERGITEIDVECCPYCGAPEHSYYPDSQWNNRFRLQTKVQTEYGELLVSTVNLMYEHADGFFETMIFPSEGFKLNLCSYDAWRYWTKEEAVKKHNEICSLLKEGKYEFQPVEYRLVLRGEI